MKGERALGKKLEEKMDGGCDGFCSVLHYALQTGASAVSAAEAEGFRTERDADRGQT